MRKLVLVGLMFVIGLAGTSAFGLITGSAHDFKGDGWSTNKSGAAICAPCHTPHRAVGTLAPLWNHTNTVQSFTMYGEGGAPSATYNPAAQSAEPGDESMACLSCHDGSVSYDAYGGNSGGSTINAEFQIPYGGGTSLKNDHPISFTYDGGHPDVVAAKLNDPTAAPINGWLFSGEMECASCHDVHNAAGFDPLLRASNVNSALCLTCHAK